MALVLADRVQQTATANTTVSFTLVGAVSGFQSFAVIGNGNTAYYSAFDTAGNWEVGIGTYSTTGPTLTRTTVLSSSNSGSAVTFPGALNVFVTYPSEKSVNLDASGNVSPLGTVASGTWEGTAVDVAHGGTGLTNVNAGYILYGNGTGALGSDVDLQFDGSTLKVGPGYLIAGATNPIAGFVGTANQYIQTYTFNSNTGTSASADFTAYPDNGTDLSGWVDMGITSSGYNDPTYYPITEENEGYLLMSAPTGSGTSGNLVYATDSTGTANAHQWYVGGFTQAKSAWKMQLTSSGLELASALGTGYGGTGLTTFGGANEAIYSTSSSSLTSGTLPVAAGGTGQSSYTDGQLLIGNSTGNTLAKSTLTAGTGISITNGSGSITIDSTGISSYPGSGIPNSTGSSWGTSYSTSGTGTVVALATAASLSAPQFTAYKETVNTIGTVSGTTQNLDLSTANIFDVTLGNNVTFTFTNPPSSGTAINATVILRQDATGNRLATFTNAKYTDGTAPVLSTGANQIDVLTFFTLNGGSFWFGTFAMANVS